MNPLNNLGNNPGNNPENTIMNAQAGQALSQLKDIIEPAAVSWWPLSHAVWAVIIGVLGFLMGLVWTLWVRHKNNRYRREAQLLFNQALEQAQTPQEKIIATNQLLKQVALTHYGREKVASLTGKDWIQFLHETAVYIDLPEQLETLLASAYANHPVDFLALEAFLKFAQAWIKGHHK